MSVQITVATKLIKKIIIKAMEKEIERRLDDLCLNETISKYTQEIITDCRVIVRQLNKYD